ncbi:CBS domain-containing protein [Romboutsia sp.]|uniref:CBS domain-containing protein n=1 Tax=Romboutsia sp. TaxID=1965302 RepID=UPI00216F7EFD|nr:CBS domain-containing protein [Romboutsia sp.]MCI9062938.1 CBS domain-containing protein [Romboutsia sp.]
MKVSECMCKDVCFVKPNCKVYDAARIMCENHIGCIPVCDDNKCVVGILTDRDIVLRSVACNKDSKNTQVSDVMTTNVCTCGCNEDMCDAENTMAREQIRRVPVVDENNKMVGILTMGNLAQNDKKLGQQNVCTTIENICNCQGSVQNCE